MDGFKKNVERRTTMILQKAGAMEKTLDKEYEEQERRFKVLETKTGAILKEAKAYLDSFRGMNLAQCRISETIKNFYDETAVLGLCGLKYQDAVESIDTQIKPQTDADYRSTVLEPIERYISIFPDIHEAIKRREKKALDYDALRAKVKKLTEKPSDDASKLPRAEQACMTARESYEASNQQLKDEIPKIIDARIPYFDPSIEALIKLQLEFYTRSYQTLFPLQKYFSQDGGDLNAKMQDILQRMRDLSIVKNSKK